MDNIHNQVADALWDHIQALDEAQIELFIPKHKNDQNLYLEYKAQLTTFIKEEVLFIFQVHEYDTNAVMYSYSEIKKNKTVGI